MILDTKRLEPKGKLIEVLDGILNLEASYIVGTLVFLLVFISIRGAYTKLAKQHGKSIQMAWLIVFVLAGYYYVKHPVQSKMAIKDTYEIAKVKVKSTWQYLFHSAPNTARPTHKVSSANTPRRSPAESFVQPLQSPFANSEDYAN